MTARPAGLPWPFRGAVCTLAWTGLVLTLGFTPALASELRQTAIVKAFQRAKASVVNIRGEKTIAASSSSAGHVDPGRRVNGMGTGVVIDPRGYVLTNHHVVARADQTQVVLHDGATLNVEWVRSDPMTDLAVLKVKGGEAGALAAPEKTTPTFGEVADADSRAVVDEIAKTPTARGDVPVDPVVISSVTIERVAS